MVSLPSMYERLEKCRCLLKLLLIDACRNDPRRDMQKSAFGPPGNDAAFAGSLERPPEGILLLASCAGTGLRRGEEIRARRIHGVSARGTPGQGRHVQSR